MKCPRCDGAMIYDKFYGSHDQFWGWKCVICGEIIDQVILLNRQLNKVGGIPKVKSRTKRYVFSRFAE